MTISYSNVIHITSHCPLQMSTTSSEHALSSHTARKHHPILARACFPMLSKHYFHPTPRKHYTCPEPSKHYLMTTSNDHSPNPTPSPINDWSLYPTISNLYPFFWAQLLTPLTIAPTFPPISTKFVSQKCTSPSCLSYPRGDFDFLESP